MWCGRSAIKQQINYSRLGLILIDYTYKSIAYLHQPIIYD
nr:MAG TPA: hypothetical protein [Caudoviricetes sp.]